MLACSYTAVFPAGIPVRVEVFAIARANITELSLVCLFVLICFEWACQDLSGFLAIKSQVRPTKHAASSHKAPSLTSLPKDDEVSCEVRPPRSPIRSFCPERTCGL